MIDLDPAKNWSKVKAGFSYMGDKFQSTSGQPKHRFVEGCSHANSYLQSRRGDPSSAFTGKTYKAKRSK